MSKVGSPYKKKGELVRASTISDVQDTDLFSFADPLTSDEQTIAWSLLLDKIEQDIALFEKLVIVNSLDDFPEPVGGVITLANDTAYFIDGSVGIGSNRIQCGIRATIFGVSPEISYLHNTMDDQPLLTANETVSLWRITLYTAGSGTATILDLDGSTATQNDVALDWQFVNFSGGDVGTIKDYGNAIFNTIGFIDKSADGLPALGDGLIFDGTIGTVAFTDSIFVVGGSGNTAITVPATATLTRRIRLSQCAVVAFSSAVGVDVSASATIPDEGFILQGVNFSGGSTYLGGLDYTSDTSRFEGCRGITNTYAAANYYMHGNATVTTISADNTPVKVAGTTTNASITQKYTHTDNRATYDGSLTRLSKIIVTLSLSSGTGDKIGVYIAKNGTPIDASETYITANASGRVENGTCQTIDVTSTGDYYEVWVENFDATNNITVEDMNVTIIDA